MIRRRKRFENQDDSEEGIQSVGEPHGKRKSVRTKTTFRLEQCQVLMAVAMLIITLLIILHELYCYIHLNRIAIPTLYLARPSDIRVARTAVVSMHRGLKFAGYLGWWFRSTKKAFAARHSYAYYDDMPPKSQLYKLASWQKPMSIYFDKLRVLLHVMERHPNLDYILWLDGDAVVTEPRLSVENQLQQMTAHRKQNNKPLCMVWATDTMGPNAGVLLLANSRHARDLIRTSLAFVTAKNTFADQASLTEVIASNKTFSDCAVLLKEPTLLQSRVRGHKKKPRMLFERGDWILHLPNHNRWQLLQSLSKWVPTKDRQRECKPLAPVQLPNLNGLSEERRQRYEAVREAIRHSWNRYAQFRYPYPDDINPVTGAGESWLYHAATLHDSLDTLYIANLTKEFDAAVVAATSDDIQCTALRPTKTFEYSLRVIGGLLGAYSVSGDQRLLEAAARASDSVLAGPFAWSPTALPRKYDILAPQGGWAAGLHRTFSLIYRWGRDVFTHEHYINSIAGVGSFGVEFNFLSQVTGATRYQSASNAVFQHVSTMAMSNGMVPNIWNVMTGTPLGKFATLASGGDSFYEYLLKAPLMNGCNSSTSTSCSTIDRNMLELYDQVVQQCLSKTHVKKIRGILYPVDRRVFHHLLCFLPGLLALRELPSELSLAKQLLRGCNDSYAKSVTGLGPEKTEIGGKSHYLITKKQYLLRPEHVESLFVLYRKTGNKVYQEMGWDIFLSLEKYCKTKFGYSGLEDVTTHPQVLDGTMPSYFLAETLKYLLLLFAPDDYISLDEFVFTTEAHPLRQGVERALCPVDRNVSASLPIPWTIIVILGISVSSVLALVVMLLPFLKSIQRTSKKGQAVLAS